MYFMKQITRNKKSQRKQEGEDVCLVSCLSPLSLPPHLAHWGAGSLLSAKAVKTRRKSDFTVEFYLPVAGADGRNELIRKKILHVASKLPFGDVPSPSPSNYTLQPLSKISLATIKCSQPGY